MPGNLETQQWPQDRKRSVFILIPKKSNAKGCSIVLDNCTHFTASNVILKILKDDAMKVLHSICQQIGKLSSGHRTGKGQFSFQYQRKSMPKDVQTTVQLCSSHMLGS